MSPCFCEIGFLVDDAAMLLSLHKGMTTREFDKHTRDVSEDMTSLAGMLYIGCWAARKTCFMPLRNMMALTGGV